MSVGGSPIHFARHFKLEALGDHVAVASLTPRSILFCALLLVLTSLPLPLYGEPILSLWVGARYAGNRILFLET